MNKEEGKCPPLPARKKNHLFVPEINIEDRRTGEESAMYLKNIVNFEELPNT